MKNKIYLFVDGANIFYAQRNSKFWIDWKKLLEYIEQKHEGTVDMAFYYIGRHIPPEARSERYIKMLTHIGFTVRTKDIKTFTDDVTGKQVSKANLDIEIAIDMLHTLPQYDIAILMSGDGDFERVIEIVRDSGLSTYVYSERTTLSKELRNAVGRHFMDFTTIEEIHKKANPI